MGATAPWYENEELWAELLPVLVDDAVVKAAEEEARQVVAILGAPPGAHLLDLGCGAGRHSIALARMHYRMTGVDRTSLYLEQAGRRASGAGVTVEWIRRNMLEYRREAVFDGAFCLFTSFGYFESRDDDLQVLRNVHFSLRPGGVFVVETIGKEVLARIFDARHWQETTSSRYWMQEREITPGWERIRNRWVFAGGGRETRQFTFEHRLFSAVELAAMFEQAGFQDVAAYGGLDRRPYDRDSRRLVVTGRK